MPPSHYAPFQHPPSGEGAAIDEVAGEDSISEGTSIAGRPVLFLGTPTKEGGKAEIYFKRDQLRFVAKYANKQELAEILLTALSYPARPGQPGFLRIPFRRIKLEKDPANTLITRGKFKHVVENNDSGAIIQPGEPTIRYTVGPPPAALAGWFLRQEFIGHAIAVSYSGLQAGTLQVVFYPIPGSEANPVTFQSVVRNDREFVHALMTILTYHPQ